MGMFDQVARHVCKSDGTALLQWILLNQRESNYVFHSWEDTRRLSLPGRPDRTNDLVAILKSSESDPAPVRCIVEVQAEPQKFIFPRIGVYELLLLQELDDEQEPSIFSVLLNLTGDSLIDGWQSKLGRLAVRPIVINLKNESASRLLTEIEEGKLGRPLLPWVPLMEDGGSPDSIERWKRLASQESSVERRREYRDFALIFAELSKKLVLWQRALEGFEMLESQLILGWMRQGKEQGLIEKSRADILRVIAVRLQDPVPEDLMLAIEGTNDDAILDRWFNAALIAPSMSEFRKKMKLPEQA